MSKIAFHMALRFALFVERLSAALTRIVLSAPSDETFDAAHKDLSK